MLKKSNHEEYLKVVEERKQRPQKLFDVHDYSLSGNAMFLRFYPQTINKFYNSRLINAMLYGNKVVFDCGYTKYMNHQESSSCAKQLLFSFSSNRIHDMPFDLHFCNVDKSSHLMKQLYGLIPTMYNHDFPINIHQESYLDVFDREKLVYLTPHCNNELKEYDPDAIYIIGAFVDKQKSQPISLARAKKQNLKMAKLPLDTHIDWGTSTKNLTLDQVLKILLDVQRTKDWSVAMKHVPRRKLKKYHLLHLQQKVEQETFRMLKDQNESNPLEKRQITSEYLSENRSFKPDTNSPVKRHEHSFPSVDKQDVMPRSTPQFQHQEKQYNDFRDSDFSHKARAKKKKW